MRCFEELRQFETPQGKLGPVEIFDRFAKVDQHQVALVANQRVQRRCRGTPIRRFCFHRLQRGTSFFGDLLALFCFERVPLRIA